MPIVPAPIQQTQIVTPANPPTGSLKLYPKADGNFYKLDSAGVEVALGGAGGTQAADTEEFLPAAAATTITLGRPPSKVLMVTRDGLVQSYVDGHYTLAGSVLTFTDAFNGAERVAVTYAFGTIYAAGPMGPSASVHEEFMPANGVTVLTLSQACQALLLVARNGIVQSTVSGNYTIAGNVITFTDAFNGSERVVVEYAQSTTTPAPPFNGSGLVDGSVTSSKLAAGLSLTGDLTTPAWISSRRTAAMSSIQGSSTSLLLNASLGVQLGVNATYGTDGTWNHVDTGQPTALLSIRSNGVVDYYYAAAGANPITAWAPGGARVCVPDVDTAWRSPVLINSWAAYTGTWAPFYRKMPDGRVIMRGLIQGGANGTIAFQLPPGYRPNPAYSYLFACCAAFGVIRNDVGTDGVIQIGPEVKAGTYSSVWISLNEITFLAEA